MDPIPLMPDDRYMEADNKTREDLATRLLSLCEIDQTTLAELGKKGELRQGYHPVMRQVHEDNAEALKAIIDEVGWPGISIVGEQAAEAAWLIAQHAVFDTDFMHFCCDLLERAVLQIDAKGWQLAFLKDRILTMSGEKQIYGTQFDEDEDGWPVPFPVRDPEGVDERRKELGLNSLSERTTEMRDRKEMQIAVTKPKKSE